MPESDQIRNVLWTVLEQLNPDEARNEQASDLLRLLEVIRSYGKVSPKIIQLIRSLGSNNADVLGELSANERGETLVDLNVWLAEKGLPPFDEISIPPERLENTTRASPVPRRIIPSVSPLLQPWSEFVPGVRDRLLSESGPLPPFARWMLPQYRWSSRWIDAFEVVAAEEDYSGSGFVLVPSEDAAKSPEANECWQMRALAAKRADSIPKSTVSGKIARVVLDIEAGLPCGISLLRSDLARRTLADRIPSDQRLSARQCVELGISLCGILGMLNAHQIHVMELSPATIAFDWNSGHRITQLLDPTAVIPGEGLLPEWRGAELGLANAPEFGNLESSQVFLVGALVLALMCGTVDALLKAQFPEGRSATFAVLSGSPKLADSYSDSIAAPLVLDLSRHVIRADDPLEMALVVKALQWSLAEQQNYRYDTLQVFAAELSQALVRP